MSSRLALLPAYACFALITILITPWPLPASFIKNPDAYVRLERIRQWIENGEWYARGMERVGDVPVILHWTRPLDTLTALAAWPFSALGPTHSLLAGSVFLALTCGLLVLSLIPATLKPFVRPSMKMVAFSVLFVALMPEFLFVYLPHGWPDHHGLLYLAFIGQLIFARRLLEGIGNAPYLLGLIQAFALWLSPEALIGIFTIHCGLALVWLNRNEGALPRRTSQAALSFLIGVILALFAEFSTLAPDAALDRLSLFSLYVAAALVLTWSGIAATTTAPLPRLALAGLWGGIGTGALYAIAPDVVHGPMAHADPWFVTVWSAMFSDGFGLPSSSSLLITALGVLGGGWLAWRTPDLRPAFALLVPSMAVFALLGVTDTTRWSIYSALAALGPMLGMAERLAIRIPTNTLRAAAASSVLSAPTLLLAAHLSFITPVSSTAAAQSCDVDVLVETLKTHRSGRIVAHSNLTPTLLFHTNHSVASVPIHPNAQAVRATFDTMSGPPGKIHGDWLVICPHDDEALAYGRDPNGLHALLSANALVDGLMFEGDAGGYRLYRIEDASLAEDKK